MSSSCKKIDLKKSVSIKNSSSIDEFRFSDFWIEWILRGHFFTIVGIPTNEGFDIPFAILHNSDDECQIGFFDRSFCDLELKCMHGTIILRYDYDTTRVLIESMYDTGSLDTVDDRRIGIVTIISTDSECLKVMKESVHECSLSPSFSWGWMGIHSSILVDDREVIILEYDIDPEIFSLELHGFDFPLNLDNISSIDFLILGKILSIAVYFPPLDHLLDIAA